MRPARSTVFVSFCLVMCWLGGEIVRAERLYGNGSLSYERISQTNAEITEDDLTREYLLINYEDVLFTKNRLRLTANVQRREYPSSDYHELLPIYYLDLSSSGYALSARYSPYKRRAFQNNSQDFADVFYRDWRLTAQVQHNNWPTFDIVYSHLRSTDRAEVRRNDSFNRNLVLESSYNYRALSLRANYNNLRQVSKIRGGSDALTETYTATTGVSKSVSGLGYVSTTYNYYDTRRTTNNIRDQESNTHLVSSIVSMTAIPHVTVNASYSGRFTDARQRGRPFEDDNQNVSARAEYSPTTYLTFQTGKGYQISSRPEGNDVVEYVTLGATLTRYVRKGADTRFTFDRTIFQQSLRLLTIRDSVGTVIGTISKGDYTLDTYNASLNFVPLPYVKSYLNITLTHDNDPIDSLRRYQLIRSLDTRVYLTSRLEGRFTITALHQGEKLRLDRSFSENYNVGLTFIPRSNLNINTTYIYSIYRSAVTSRNSSFTGYISYSFRRAFTLYVSVNRRVDKRQQQQPGTETITETESRPRAIDSQILMYLSGRTTLSVSYVRNRADNVLGQKRISESIQGVLTVQI